MARKLTDAQADDLVRLYLAGKSTKELGPMFGISSRAVSDYLRRAGVRARSRGEALRLARSKLDPEYLRQRQSEAMRRRWANATEEERRRMLEAAHAAARGKPLPLEVKVKIAMTRAQRAEAQSEYERQVAEWLRERGVEFVQQKAVGPYNVDFAIGNVAVEVTTGWARKKQWRDRLAYLFDRGWHLYVIWHDTRVPLLPAVADDLVAWLKVLQATPPEGCQYRVVWRSTQVLASGRADADEVAAVLKSATPLHSRPHHKRASRNA